MTCDLRSPIQIIGIDQFYFLNFELGIGMVNCTVSATLFIYLRYLGDNPNSSLISMGNKSSQDADTQSLLKKYQEKNTNPKTSAPRGSIDCEIFLFGGQHL